MLLGSRMGVWSNGEMNEIEDRKDVAYAWRERACGFGCKQEGKMCTIYLVEMNDILDLRRRSMCKCNVFCCRTCSYEPYWTIDFLDILCKREIIYISNVLTRNCLFVLNFSYRFP